MTNYELFIGNLNRNVQINDLIKLFDRYGKIIQCKTFKATRRVNYAFVRYTNGDYLMVNGFNIILLILFLNNFI